MALYLSIIAIAAIILFAVDIIYFMPIMSFSPIYIGVAIIVAIIYQFAVDGLVAFTISKLPNKWFGKDNKLYHVTKKHQKIYEFFGIRKWKDAAWELGGLGGFSKSKILNPNEPEYIERFLIESNKGVFEHILSIFAGFSVIFIFPIKYVWIVSVPIAVVNLLLNYMSTMILRYNTPKLHTLYKRAVRNKERQNEKNA